MCAACLNANPRFRYHCGVCTDDARREEKLASENNRPVEDYRKCGTELTQKLQCPRGSPTSNYCQNALINDGLVGAYESNFYTVARGETCLIIIQNSMTALEGELGFWKIWKEELDL